VSLFAIAGYKSLPALQQVYNSFTKIKFYAYTVELLYNEFKEDSEVEVLAINSRKVDFKKNIELSNIAFSYGPSSRKIIQDLSLIIDVNSTVGFVGATGAGKTTVVDIIMGLLTPNSGKILVDGVTLDDSSIQSWQSLISYVPQRIYLSDDTVINNIAFGIEKDKIDFDRIIEVAKMARIHDLVVNDLPDGYNSFIGERGIRLSGGQAQRIGIARALYRKPTLLVLDEATSALDNVTESEVVEMIKSINGKCTIIMIAHRLTTIESCDQVYYLKDGVLKASGRFSELLDREESFRDFARMEHKYAVEENYR
jgi:ABC-type bacteriocin/lantibiotic exporter with double-glycine peptidase domain